MVGGSSVLQVKNCVGSRDYRRGRIAFWPTLPMPARLGHRFMKVPPPLSQLEHRAGSIPKDQRIVDRRTFAPKILRFHGL